MPFKRIKPLHKLNPKSGSEVKLDFDEFPNGFVLVIDSNESNDQQNKPLFTPICYSGLMVVRRKLKYGDYSVQGFEHEISFERKTVSDLYGSCFKNWERFLNELINLSLYPLKWIVIEGSEKEVLSWQDYSTIHPNSMRGRLAAIEVKLGIPIHYEPDRRVLERWILDRMTRFYRIKREGKDSQIRE